MIENSLILIGITTLIIYILYKWMTETHDYFEKRGLPYLKSNYGIGNTAGFLLKRYKPNDYIMKLYNTFPNEKLFGLYDFRNPFLFIRDPDIIKKLSIKEFDYFVDHRSFLNDNVDTLFGNSLIMLRGQKWRDMRATLSPAFTGSKMRQMFELVTDCAEDLCEFYKNKIHNNNCNNDAAVAAQVVHIEMKDLFQRYANDVIASCAFGLKVSSHGTSTDDGNQFFNIAKRFMNLTHPITALKLVLMRLCPSLMKKLNIQFVPTDVRIFFKSLVFNTMEVREKQGIFRPDMINILMNIKKNGEYIQNNEEEELNGKKKFDEKLLDGFAAVDESHIGKEKVKRIWSNDEIAAQCFLFFIAGFDTTSTVLSFIFYELAVDNNGIQQKLYNEVKITENNLKSNQKQLTYDVIQKMEYLDMIVSEALRKWPPALVTDRVCVKKYTLNDDDNDKHKLTFTFDEGMTFWIPIYGLHHDPKYFPEPEKFDPERFSVENKPNINLNAYIPFGVGPRNCIGSRFALMEVKTIIYYIILNFIIVPNKDTQIPIQLGKSAIGVITEKGIHLDMKLRKN